MTSKSVILWGGTGQARVLNEFLVHEGYRVVAIVDNRKIESPLVNTPILLGEDGLDKWLSARKDEKLLGLAAIGGNHGLDRKYVNDLFRDKNIENMTVIHYSAFVASNAIVGDGSQILANSAVCANAKIGKGCIVNTGATVDHDCVIDDYVHIAPGVHIGGETKIGFCSFIGIGAIVLPKISIGMHVTIGAGSIVTKDIPDGVKAIGVPARIF